MSSMTLGCEVTAAATAAEDDAGKLGYAERGGMEMGKPNEDRVSGRPGEAEEA